MSKPDVTKNLGGYIFSWTDHSIQVSVSSLKTHSDSRVTGIICVQAVNGEGELAEIYPRTAYNFSADTTRKQLATNLTQRAPKLPWVEMVDQLCSGIQTRVREGESVQELISGPDVERPEYLLDPIIIKNYPNVIFGDPSAAKSTLAVILSQLLILPWYDNPLGMCVPERSLRVLYCDWETDADTILWQTTTLQRGMGLGILTLKYRHCALPLALDIDQLKRHIAADNIDMIIVDSMGLASGGELKETQAPLGFYAALRELKVTSLILAHNSKDREAKTRSIYGNQFFTAGARNVWELRKQQEYGSLEMDLALFHRKPPPFAQIHKPLGFKVTFGADTMQVSPSDPRTVSEFIDQMGAKERIVELLKGGTLPTKEIVEAINIARGTIDTALGRLKRDNRIVKVGDRWGLVSTYDD